MKHSNVAIFVPHNGCPNQCSFCNQKQITGQCNQPTADDVDKAVNIAINSKNYSSENSEIAFFGGSFTAIEKDYMLLLLKTAYKYVCKGMFKGIRISTRPDCINEDILDILKKYGVTAIELGAQSMVASVLLANDRGHTCADVVKASNLIKDYCFSLGLQMMTGLYKSSNEYDIFTAEALAKLKPDTVRIYPTIVMENTRLAQLYREGKYNVSSLEDAVSLCSRLLIFFKNENINVIRLGLHSSDDIEHHRVAGPWHPAFRELCESRSLYTKFLNELSQKPKGIYNIYVNSKMVSKAVGQKKCNVTALKETGYDIKFIGDKNLSENAFVIKQILE